MNGPIVKYVKHFLNLPGYLKYDKPWLIIGKGPTFSKIHELNLNDYYTFGLNHVSYLIPVTIAHCIDFNVVTSRFYNCEFALLPWHPHINFKATKKTLQELVLSNETLQDIDIDGRLYYYDCSTYARGPVGGRPVIKVKYFSAEAAFGILEKLGVERNNIFTIGIDGGKSYAEEFNFLKPLQNGRKSFNDQFKYITKREIK